MELDRILDDLVFSTWDQAFLSTEAGKKGREDVIVNRFHDALRYTVPWLSEHVDLRAASITEIGCGSGSSTAALGLHAARVRGYDIDAAAVAAARARCSAYGLANVELTSVEPQAMLSTVLERAADTNVFLLYAVLEHLTYPERLETLAKLWAALPPGGHLVIVETPNRFAYVDQHSSDTEFLHLLPDELALPWVARAKREAFRIAMREPLRAGPEAASLARIRYGIGASFHELVLAIDEPLADVVVADGFEPEMLAFFHAGLDEELLVRFFLERPVEQPMGFARCVLNLILRKPRDEADRRSCRELDARRRAALTESRSVGRDAPTHHGRFERFRAALRSYRARLSRR